MPRLVAVAGLPGSGKSTLFQSEEFTGPLSRFIVLDDMGYDERWFESDAERVQWNNDPWMKTLTLARVALGLGVDVVLADVDFCRSERRHWLMLNFPSHSIEWIFFANAPETCEQNVRVRGRPGRIDIEVGVIRMLTGIYTPEGDAILHVAEAKPKFAE